MENKKHDIFISYSSIDKDVAYKLCHAIEKQGLVCWIAPRNIGVGQYAKAIVDAIKNSQSMVLLFSSHSNKSKDVLKELTTATNHNLSIIPLRIEDVLPTDSMEYHLMANQFFDTFNPTSDSDFENITKIVKGTIENTNSEVQSFYTPSKKKKNKGFLNKTLVFLILILALITTITLQQVIIEKHEKINELYEKLLEKNKNNPTIISQAEHIKNIAGYEEAIKYFRSDNKNLFYSNYEKVKILYISAHGSYIDNNESIMVGNGSIINSNNKEIIYDKFSLNIKTVPILSNIKIINSKDKYKNNIYLIKDIYTIQISSDGYASKEFLININRDINLTVELDLIPLKEK